GEGMGRHAQVVPGFCFGREEWSLGRGLAELVPKVILHPQFPISALRHGIRANMDINDIEYFERHLEHKSSYNEGAGERNVHLFFLTQDSASGVLNKVVRSFGIRRNEKIACNVTARRSTIYTTLGKWLEAMADNWSRYRIRKPEPKTESGESQVEPIKWKEEKAAEVVATTKTKCCQALTGLKRGSFGVETVAKRDDDVLPAEHKSQKGRLLFHGHKRRAQGSLQEQGRLKKTRRSLDLTYLPEISRKILPVSDRRMLEFGSTRAPSFVLN
ncbi:hypothetical protein Tco_0200506, partial [Tanacetum coccineum]